MCTRGIIDNALCPHTGYHCADDTMCYSSSGTLEPVCPTGSVPNRLKCGFNKDYPCYNASNNVCKNVDDIGMFDPIGDIVYASNELYHTAMYYASVLFTDASHVSTDEMKMKTHDLLQANWTKLSKLFVSSSDIERINNISIAAINQTRKTDVDREVERRAVQLRRIRDRIRATRAGAGGAGAGGAGAGGAGAGGAGGAGADQHGGGKSVKLTVADLLIYSMINAYIDPSDGSMSLLNIIGSSDQVPKAIVRDLTSL